MRRPPLVSASLRETRFLCLSRYRERETKSCRMDMQQKCCNNTRRSLPASPDTIRYYLYTFHPPPDRPTDQQRSRDVQKKIRQIRHHHHPHSHHTENQCKIHQLHQYLPAVFSVRHETYLTLPHLTLPHLTSPFLDPTQKRKTSSQIHPSIHPRGPVPHDIRVSSEILLSESSSYYLKLTS